MRKSFLASLLGLTLLSAVAHAAPPRSEPDITTLGGDDTRNHLYHSPRAGGLCLQRTVPTGMTLAQPLVVNFPPGVGPGQPVIFHLGETHLFVLNLAGEVLASHRVQPSYSWGNISYAKLGQAPDPAHDVLYISTGDPGVKAYLVADLLQSQRTAEPLGVVTFEARGIASAPLYMGLDAEGLDLVVVGVVPQMVVTIKGLATWRDKPGWTGPEHHIEQLGEWNSGTAVKLSDTEFAIVAGNSMYFYATNPLRLTRSLPLETPGLSQIIQEGRQRVLTVGETGTLSVVDYAGKTIYKQIPTIPGFINTGPASDTEQVYLGFRWENSASAGAPGSDHGRLVAVRKNTWTPAQTAPARLDTAPGAGRRSWVNVTPVIWAQPDRPDDRLILLGDAGGAVSAWTPAGQPGALFLTRPWDLTPVACSEFEQTDTDNLPAVSRSHRAVLSYSPSLQPKGATAWHNTQGVSSEMVVYQGRLLAGYNHSTPAESALTIFRSATNAAITGVDVQDNNGNPIGGERTVRPFQEVRVTVHLRLEGDPVTPRTVKMAVGWANRAPEVQAVTLTPFADGTATFQLQAPATATDLVAVINPALYARRRNWEQAATGQAGPAELPSPWQGLASEPPPIGEWTVLDNAWHLPVTPEADDPFLQSLYCPTGPIFPRFPLVILMGYRTTGDAPADVSVRAVLRGEEELIWEDAPRIPPNRAVLRELDFGTIPPGTYDLTVRLSPGALRDSDLANNIAECHLVVEECPGGGCESADGSVLTSP